jgi:hypothetical protein
MVRFVAFDLIFFLLPFGAYALWLFATRRTVRNPDDWQVKTLAWLLLAGAVLFLGVIVYFIHFDTEPPGGKYVPAHMENGEIVPGHIELPDAPQN